jgi:hypothetical protein
LREEVGEGRYSDFDDDDESDGGDENIPSCFYREWWRKSCQIFTPASKEHAFHIGLVHEYITDTKPVKEHNTG